MRPPLTPPELCSWTLSDGYELQGRIWPPRGSTAQAVIYLHGIQSHGGWFEWSASVLASAGVPVILPDRRGSGRNKAARGDTPSAERWLADLDELAAWSLRTWQARCGAVVGISWGGKLAVAWALRTASPAARLLLVAPGIFPALDVGFLTRLHIGIALLTRSQRQFTIPLNDPALFTDETAGREFIATDPHKLTRATAAFLYASAHLDRLVRRAGHHSLRADVTLVLAGRDRIIRNAPTAAWLRRTAARPPVVHVLDDAAHTLEFEPNPVQFGQLLTAWARELATGACAAGTCCYNSRNSACAWRAGEDRVVG